MGEGEGGEGGVMGMDACEGDGRGGVRSQGVLLDVDG